MAATGSMAAELAEEFQTSFDGYLKQVSELFEEHLDMI
jgi:LPS O-antigen subunit length determinant protein (WzzB/FepE family)